MRIWREGKFWVLRGTFVGLVVSLALVISALALNGTWREAGPGSAAAFLDEPVATPTAAEPTTRLVLEVTPVPASPTPTRTVTPTSTVTVAATATSAPLASVPPQQATSAPVNTPVPPTAVPPTSTEPPAPPPPSCPTAPLTGYAADLFNALNAERNAQGMSSLSSHGCAVFVAQVRSDDMANLRYFSHTSPTGETAFSLLDEHNVAHGWAGENLATRAWR
jgi:uncharacterized protein YkwD